MARGPSGVSGPPSIYSGSSGWRTRGRARHSNHETPAGHWHCHPLWRLHSHESVSIVNVSEGSTVTGRTGLGHAVFSASVVGVNDLSPPSEWLQSRSHLRR